MNNYLSALLADEQPTAGVSFGGGLPIESKGQGNAFADVNLSDIQSARHRTNRLESGLMFAKDAFDYITGLDPNAYAGKTAKLMNDYEKTRMEEDPEGHQADINRAKVLSARAAATDDMDLKRKYGAAIKTLLPKETQGLDDITASDFFNSTDNKLKLEQLKGYNKLQQIALQNQGKMDVASANNMSREGIAAAKNATNMQIKELDGQIRQAIADGKNDTALALQDKRAELQIYKTQLDNAADLQQEAMRQEGAMNRTVAQQEGAYNRVVAQNAGALERVNAQQAGQDRRNDTNNKTKLAIAMMKPVGGSGSGGKGTAKEREANELVQYRLDNWDDYIAKQNADLGVIDRAIQVLEENPSATGLRTYLGMSAGGFGIAPATERAYGELNEKTTQMVLDIVRQLNAAGATSSVFNSPAEQEKIIGDIINPRAPYNARLAAYKSFRDRLKRYYENERKLTAWKGSKIGYSMSSSYSNQSEQPRVVTASEVNKNSRVIDGGVEW